MNAERQARPVCDYVGGELIYLDCGEPLREYYIDKGYIEIEEVRGKGRGELLQDAGGALSRKVADPQGVGGRR